MHAEFKDIGTPLDRVVEETGEVLQRIGKVLRFGWENSNPLLPEDQRETNENALKREVKDLLSALVDLSVERGW